MTNSPEVRSFDDYSLGQEQRELQRIAVNKVKAMLKPDELAVIDMLAERCPRPEISRQTGKSLWEINHLIEFFQEEYKRQFGPRLTKKERKERRRVRTIADSK